MQWALPITHQTPPRQSPSLDDRIVHRYSSREPSPGAEFEVDAGAYDVFGEAHNGACGASAVSYGRAGGVRQVNEEIFRFDCPIGRKGNLDSGTDRPPRFGRTVKRGRRVQAGLDVAEGGAGSAVYEDTVECITDTATHGGQPLALCLTTLRGRYYRRNGATRGARITMQIGPIAVTLDAKNIVAYLVIGAKRATNEEAGCGEATGRSNRTIRPIAVAGPEAAIDA